MTKKDTSGRKSYTVWLSPRHQRMLDAMEGFTISDLARESIEDLFEGRHERDYAALCMEGDLKDLLIQWDKKLGTTSSYSITSTKDGFRIVLVSLKDYDG